MDPLDLVMKVIIKITRNYGKKVQKREKTPEIPLSKPQKIKGETFRLGFAKEKIMPNLDSDKTYWIAGHGSGHKMEDVVSDVYVHAVWLDCGKDEGILWLSADIIGMTRIEINKIREMIMNSSVIKGCKHINYSATHSHSGIDTLGYWGKPFASVPSDGKDTEYMEMLMQNSLKVAEEAYKNRKTGKLYFGNIKIENSLSTRRGFSNKNEILSRFRFVPDDGSVESWIMNFGAHPNSLGGSNRSLSGEYPYFMRKKILKETGAKVLFGVGAIGAMDAVRLDEDNLECVKKQGLMIANAALNIENDIELSPSIKFLTQPFYYPVDNYVLTLLALKHTMSFKAFPYPESLTGISMETEITYMDIGGKKILTLPGESFVSTVYGPYLSLEESTVDKAPEINPKTLCEICGDNDLIVFGVTNDMTGYVVPPNDFLLNPTQPFLNGVKDKNGLNHYHETNSMGYNSQKVIADCFTGVVERFNK